MATPNKLSLNIEIPLSFKSIDPTSVADLVRNKEPSTVIFDVRDDDFVGGHIRSAINLPYDEFEKRVEEIVAQYSNHKNIIFTCMFGQLRSPAAALAFIAKLPDKSLAESVYVLQGGFQEFIRVHHGDEAIIVEFDPTLWNSNWLHRNDTNPFL